MVGAVTADDDRLKRALASYGIPEAAIADVVASSKRGELDLPSKSPPHLRPVKPGESYPEI